MIDVQVLPLSGGVAIGLVVDLPKTRLVAAATRTGFIMCGALDMTTMEVALAERHVIAGRATGVRTLADLLARPLQQVTSSAERIGLHPGLTGRQALELLLRHEQQGDGSPDGAAG